MRRLVSMPSIPGMAQSIRITSKGRPAARAPRAQSIAPSPEPAVVTSAAKRLSMWARASRASARSSTTRMDKPLGMLAIRGRDTVARALGKRTSNQKVLPCPGMLSTPI